MKKLLLGLVGLFVVISFTACGEKTTGEKLDDTMDQTKEASKDAFNDMKKALGN